MLKPFLPEPVAHRPPEISQRWLAIGSVLLLIVGWSFWPVLANLLARWNSDPQYSHGFFVPVLAVAIGWFRRESVWIQDGSPRPVGLLWIVGGLSAFLAGSHIAFDWLQAAAMLPVLYGIALIMGGRWLSSIAWPGIVFLLFMIPLPFRLEVAMAQPLQRLASIASTFALQTLGIVTTCNGNLLNVEGYVLGVAEACSGLRMLVVFFALSTAYAVLGQRSWVHSLIIICSAAPIALICNIGRIVVTGVLYVYAGEELAGRVFHDLAGWLMMPAALALMWLEMKYVDLLINDRSHEVGSSGKVTAAVLA